MLNGTQIREELKTRIWVHPDLKGILSDLRNTLEEISIKETSYPLVEGMPFASKIAADILNPIVKELKKGKIEVIKLQERGAYNINICFKLKKITGIKRNELQVKD